MLYVMKQESDDTAELEWQRFKMQMIAHYPDKAREIIDELDREIEEEPALYEDGDDYDPFSAEEISYAVGTLRTLGFAVE